jgi:hypothetical protein
MSFASKFTLATVLTGALAFAHPAMAGCKRMGFTVNDYGKEGPTRDALNLLDKHVATWAAEQGIEKYSVGKKDVSCELFLNMIVFDEHTCTASATVCWGPEIQKQQEAKSNKSTAKKEAAASADSSSESKSAAKSAPAKTEEKAPATETSESKPAEKPVEAAAKSEPTSPVETGTIPVPPAAAATAEAAGAVTAAEPVKAEVSTPAEPDAAHKASAAAAEAAAAAAERAAAAAERAALAAERAAAALDRQASTSSAPATTSPAPETSSASAPVAPVAPTP